MDPVIRAQIIRDYGPTPELTSADELAAALLGGFEQAPSSRPLAQSFSNRDVFRAAVKALGSNSRTWASL